MSSSKRCYICGKTDQNPLEFGEFLTKSDISVHHFCLLFSNDLPQHGRTEKSGIARFLLADIRALHQESMDDVCVLCKSGNATIFCKQRDCSVKCHLVCGVRANMLLQFRDTFPTFCSQHYPAQLQCSDSYPESVSCDVCCKALPTAYDITKVISSCCKRGWYHTQCLREFALAAGYYFGCLMCREKKLYREHVKLLGVYVPDREAEWEGKDKEHIMALNYRHSRCDAAVCLNANGRDYRDQDNGEWSLRLCTVCAASGSHVGCLPPDDGTVATKRKYVCPLCLNVLSQRVPQANISLADQTLYEDIGELNQARDLSSDDPDLNADAEQDAVFSISSDESMHPRESIHPSESYTLSRRMDDVAVSVSPRSQELVNWLKCLDQETSSIDMRKYRLRLLLGNKIQLDRPIKM